jgi:hypothetical protein
MEELPQVHSNDAGAYIALRNSTAKQDTLIRTDAANLIRYSMRRKTRG